MTSFARKQPPRGAARPEAAAQAPAPHKGPAPDRMTFQWQYPEMFWGFPTEVTSAIAAYKVAIVQIAKARAELLQTLAPELSASIAAELDAAESGLAAVAAAQVQLEDRPAAIEAVKRFGRIVGYTVHSAPTANEAHLARKKLEDERAQQAAKEEAQQVEARRKKADQDARDDAEKQERARLEGELAERAKAAKEAADRLAAENAEKERARAEREATELAAKREAERLAQEAAERKKAAQRRPFAANQAAFEAALAAAALIPDEALRDRLADLQKAHALAVAAQEAADQDAALQLMLNPPKQKRNQRNTAAAQPPARPDHDAQLAKDRQDAHAARDKRVDDNITKYGAVAESDGAGAADADLAWAIAASNGDPELARSLSRIIAAGAGSGAGVTVAKDLLALGSGVVAALAGAAVRLLALQVPPAEIPLAAQSLDELPAAAQSWALQRIGSGSPVAEVLAFLDKHRSSPAAMAVADVRGLGAGDDDLVRIAHANGSAPDDIRWLASLPAAAGKPLIDLVIALRLNITALRPIVSHDAEFDEAHVLALIKMYPTSIGEFPRLLTLAKSLDLPIEYVEMRLRVDPNTRDGGYQDIAMRAEALLMSGATGLVEASTNEHGYADSNYGRGADNKHRLANERNNARTGYMKLTVKGDQYDFHAHWGANTAGKSLTSLHIQRARDNGPEITDLRVYPELCKTAVRVLNTMGVTGRPVGLPAQ